MSSAAPLLLALLLAHQADAKMTENACVQAIVYKEAGAEPTKGVAAVVQVIRHRAKKRNKTMCQVVKEKGQFSSYKKGMNLKRVEIPQKFLHKYKKAVTMPPVVPACVDSFHSGPKPEWAKRKRLVTTVAHHKFYC